jgi:Protein of unknown function (DUF4238)
VSEPTRHHYIPKFYLKQWMGSDGRLCEYSRPYKETKPSRKHPSGTGYVDGLYTIPGLPPEQSQFVEKSFMKAVDDWAARALAIMLRQNARSHDLDARSKAAWARFLYSLIVRTPESIIRMQQKLDEKPPQLPFPVQHFLPDVINSERVITEIVSMRFSTANFENTRHSLLTSDRPVIMTWGLVEPDAHIAIPISPKKLFLATKSDETYTAIASMASDDLVEAVNYKVSEQAIKYVYGIDDRQLRFVSKRLGRMVPSTPLG